MTGVQTCALPIYIVPHVLLIAKMWYIMRKSVELKELNQFATDITSFSFGKENSNKIRAII